MERGCCFFVYGEERKGGVWDEEEIIRYAHSLLLISIYNDENKVFYLLRIFYSHAS